MRILAPLALALAACGIASAAPDPIATNPGWSEQQASPEQARLAAAPDAARALGPGVLGLLGSPRQPARFAISVNAADLPNLRARIRPGWTFTELSRDPQWRPAGCEGVTNAIVAGRYEVYSDNPGDVAAALGRSEVPTGREQIVAFDLTTRRFQWLLPVPNDNHYYGTFRLDGDIVEVPFSPLASRVGSTYGELWVRRFDVARHIQQDVRLQLPAGARLAHVYVDSSGATYGKTTIGVDLRPPRRRSPLLRPAVAAVTPPLRPFRFTIGPRRARVVAADGRQIALLDGRRFQFEGGYVIAVAGRRAYAQALADIRGRWGLGVASGRDRWDWALVMRPREGLTPFVAGVVGAPR